MIHHEIVVVILQDHRMIGKDFTRKFSFHCNSVFFYSSHDRRRRYSRSRSPVQHSKRDNRQRSRSASPRARRNRPSSRDRSPQQQQASNIVHRYDENDD